MSTQATPEAKILVPLAVPQNPSLVGKDSLGEKQVHQELVNKILQTFMRLLPSNYVSKVTGPFYTVQFQAVAEEIARLQIAAQESYSDTGFDYTRPEFLYQLIGALVFPDAPSGYPRVESDLSYRTFLKRMVTLLLQGSTKTTLEEALDMVETISIEDNLSFDLIERGLAYRTLGPGKSGWGRHDQHTIEINVQNTDSEGNPKFPSDTFALQENIRILMRALRPAHTLYEYRHLFTETFGDFLEETESWDMSTYHYEDMRFWEHGVQAITGTAGITWTDRALFSDHTRDFSSVKPGATLHLTTGVNSTAASATDAGTYGRYTVAEVLTFPVGDDSTARAYTTSPSGLTGECTIEDGAFVDALQDFNQCVEGEVLTLADGPNAGSYRLLKTLGNEGGFIPVATGSATKVVPTASILRLDRRMRYEATGQSYTLDVDRLGIQVPIFVEEEDVSDQFWGTSGTLDSFVVLHGPLVKAWGSATPASTGDVVVRVNGVVVDVDSVNPYTAQVTLVTPVNLSISPDVTCSYYWMKSPTFTFAGLNTLGLVLNQAIPAREARNTGAASTGIGVVHPSRFPFMSVLGVPSRPDPIYIGHRYLGFERAYSALLNSETLLLNRPPNQAGLPPFARDVTGKAVAYEGTALPESPWEGDGAGSPTVSNGLLTLSGDSRKYTRTEDLTFPSSVFVAGRFFVSESTITSGVFTGVGFGIHDTEALFFVGCLEIGGVKHLGFLTDPANPSLERSWSLGFGTAMSLTSQTTARVLTSAIPGGIDVGSRFSVRAGSQAGVYTVSALTESGSYTVITVTSPFPSVYTGYGNRDITGYWEVDFTEAATYRIDADLTARTAEIRVGGAVYGVSHTVTTPPSAGLARTILTDIGLTGQAFFGSFVEQSTSSWSFFRYGIVPDTARITGRVLTMSADMGTLTPDEETQYPWSVETQDGPVSLDTNGYLYLRTFDGSSVYQRTEPFLRNSTTTDFYWKVKSDYHTPWACQISTPTKKIGVVGLLYVENAERELVQLPRFGLNPAFSDYETQGWTAAGTWTPSGGTLTLDGTGTLTQGIDGDATWQATDGSARVADFRLQATSVGAYVRVEPGTAVIQVKFANTGAIELRDNANTLVQSYAAAWQDGEPHDFRVVSEGGVVSVFVDDVLKAPTLLTASFAGGGQDRLVLGANGVGTYVWHHAGMAAIPGVTVSATLGIAKVVNPETIDDYEIPRTDSNDVPNSDLTATPEVMDWSSFVECRVRIDPQWGVTLYRPDLALPPYYDPEDGTDGSGWVTNITEPSAGWINVEWAALPRVISTYGHVQFGQDSAYSDSRWEYVRYRLAEHARESQIGPHHMVLNQFNVVNSGERLKDKAAEMVSIQTLDATRVCLTPSNLYASTVLRVIDGQTTYYRDSFTFDVPSQTITLGLDGDGEQLQFTGTHVPVTVVFIHGGPVTPTYLETQTLLQSQTLLNEGTPPWVKSFVGGFATEEIRGSTDNWPYNPLSTEDEVISTDPARYLTSNREGAIFQNVEHFEVDNDGDTGVAQYPLETALEWAIESGPMVAETVTLAASRDLMEQGILSPGVVLFASGGGFTGPRVNLSGTIVGWDSPLGGHVGPGTAICYPSYKARKGGLAGRDRRALSSLRLESVLTDPNTSTALEETVPEQTEELLEFLLV